MGTCRYAYVHMWMCTHHLIVCTLCRYAYMYMQVCIWVHVGMHMCACRYAHITSSCAPFAAATPPRCLGRRRAGTSRALTAQGPCARLASCCAMSLASSCRRRPRCVCTTRRPICATWWCRGVQRGPRGGRRSGCRRSSRGTACWAVPGCSIQGGGMNAAWRRWRYTYTAC